MRDLAAQQAGAVLRRGYFDAAAGVEHRHHERFEFFLHALGESGVEDFSRDVEGEVSHGFSFQLNSAIPDAPLRRARNDVLSVCAPSRLIASTRATCKAERLL